MKPETSVGKEIVEVHAHKSSSESNTTQNGLENLDSDTIKPESSNSKARDAWIKSEHGSLDTELPIQDQIKQDILGFVAQEMKKSDNPSFVFYSHDPNGLDEKFMKTLSRPSSGHKEKRSPSYRRKKRHSSKHREAELNDFEVAGSSFSALEKVDDYLKQYNKEEVVTLSGDLEIEMNGENNKIVKNHKNKGRKTRKKMREDHQSSGRDVSPKVFQTGYKHSANKIPVRPTDLATVLKNPDTSMHHDQYIDNPFSSPSPLTSPNDGKDTPFGGTKPKRTFVQGGGTFRQISSERTLASQKSEEDRYFRLGDQTSLGVALLAQKLWQLLSPACHGMLAGLAIMHLIIITYSDDSDISRIEFHSHITKPYAAAYYFLCVICLVSVFDRLDIPSMKWREDTNSFVHSILLVCLYMVCLLTSSVANMYDEKMVLGMNQPRFNSTGNHTSATVPDFYYTWAHISIWRSILPTIALISFVITNPKDLVYTNLNGLIQFKQSLQSFG